MQQVLILWQKTWPDWDWTPTLPHFDRHCNHVVVAILGRNIEDNTCRFKTLCWYFWWSVYEGKINHYQQWPWVVVTILHPLQHLNIVI